MIRCNNCMSTFNTAEDLSLIVEKSEFYDGEWHTTDRFIYNPEIQLVNTDTERYEIFKGCPNCLGDENLMDLTPYENEEE